MYNKKNIKNVNVLLSCDIINGHGHDEFYIYKKGDLQCIKKQQY